MKWERTEDRGRWEGGVAMRNEKNTGACLALRLQQLPKIGTVVGRGLPLE